MDGNLVKTNLLNLLYSVYHPLVVFLLSFRNCCHSHCTAQAVCVRQTLSPCLSNWSRHIYSSISTADLEVSHMTRSSAHSMAQGGSLSISEASTSMMMMMMMKSRGLIADP